MEHVLKTCFWANFIVQQGYLELFKAFLDLFESVIFEFNIVIQTQKLNQLLQSNSHINAVWPSLFYDLYQKIGYRV